MAKAFNNTAIPDGLIADGNWHPVEPQPTFTAGDGPEDCGLPRGAGIGCQRCRVCRESMFWAKGPMMYRLVKGESYGLTYEARQLG